MRLFAGLICFLFLTSCSLQSSSETHLQSAKENVLAMKEKQLNREVRLVFSQKLDQSSYPFKVRVKKDGKVSELEGRQFYEDWSLQNRHTNQIRLEKKNRQVFIYYSNQKETLSLTQAGLVSPRDHLILIRDMAQNIRELSAIRVHGKKAVLAEVKINEEKLAQRLKGRISSPHELNAFSGISNKVKVIYLLSYIPASKELLRLRVKINSPDSLQYQEITYDFASSS
ncbi:hypothetical protein ACFO25_10145 [Paenactinomyces guangxiensis]|uniref:Uncharacterized protein n=1 Tax=Paenactinomyces guangxiensis TaxID=1490290 RepID=A0A7W1WS91_9BACL|nr:hypothetical protein [Paenactinomyces guangxiensis]MBA4495145.1 hypothetical protein [Paenactinomyces guangxiensis]MBH8592171.1 hypothetical protein [Paenactinomyces guangxiensis]